MEGISAFFTQYKSIVIIIHAISAAIGLGSATVSDILFFKFLKDGKISKTETPVLKTMTTVMWVALILLVLTGISLFLSSPETYLLSSKFIVKMFIVLVIFCNGLIMTIYLHKKFKDISFVNKKNQKLKRIAFAAGSISVISWYLSFILGSVRSIPIQVCSSLLIYFGLILLGIIFSQFLYSYYQKKFVKGI